ncbi:hypothetical protein HHK36_005072 [Tetracentron sinense]|uniref:EF-hand domain-containing protein n=1 Tax=Tetracentron sinense TaxID=13715 RepID=A0A834ZKW9_TETSI|nr:hypothetical protein HHK36_005072 [Tetracentron sinense]
MLIPVVSGLSGSRETAQSQVLVGMGLLAGSTVMLLTLLWGSCVILGKCDLEDSTAIDLKDTKGLSLTGTYLSFCLINARSSSFTVIKCIETFCVLMLASRLQLLVQVFQPWIQKRKLAYAKHKHVISGILKHMHGLERLLTDDGEPNTEVIKKLFKTIDLNSDGHLSDSELRALIIGIQFEAIDLDKNEAVEKVMKDFDTSNDSHVDEDEFVKGISKWILDAKRSVVSANNGMKVISDFHHQTKREHDLLGDQSDEAVESVENARWISLKAVLMLLLGAVIAAAFADPLVDAVDNFSSATSIPSFFISFIALPLATNSSEAVSALIFASRKKQRTASLTFSEIYGAVTMNNILCLSVFLGLVYARHLTWDFSAEVLVILIVCIVMGAFASFRTTFPLWTCSVAFALYPFSLALVYVLDYVFGWS